MMVSLRRLVDLRSRLLAFLGVSVEPPRRAAPTGSHLSHSSRRSLATFRYDQPRFFARVHCLENIQFINASITTKIIFLLRKERLQQLPYPLFNSYEITS